MPIWRSFFSHLNRWSLWKKFSRKDRPIDQNFIALDTELLILFSQIPMFTVELTAIACSPSSYSREFDWHIYFFFKMVSIQLHPKKITLKQQGSVMRGPIGPETKRFIWTSDQEAPNHDMILNQDPKWLPQSPKKLSKF